MHLLYCDETNLAPRNGDFLIYGGLMVNADRLHSLSTAIDQLRILQNVPRDYQLKFNPGPENFTHQEFINLKQLALQQCHAHGARLIVYVILHDVATDADTARRNGINSVCLHFQYHLRQMEDTGLVLIDQFNDQGNQINAHLREKFNVGVTGLPYAGEMRLDRICGFHYSAIGQSHIPSLVDIALGSLRFCINAHTRQQNEHRASSEAILRILSPLFSRAEFGQGIPEISFFFSPKSIRSVGYREQYQALKNYLANNGIPTIQQITDRTTY